jgi:hypothetical protein
MNENKPLSSAPTGILINVPQSSWQNLSKKRIFFGHQSVGLNIIDGITNLMKENPALNLNIVNTSTPEEFSVPIFAHARVGENSKPKSKCDAFSRIISSGIGNKADIAFFKFCYVDITIGTDVNDVFFYYHRTLEKVKNNYPQTTFVHVTIPLRAKQTGIKAFLKRLMGKPLTGYQDNIVRNHFNSIMTKEYYGKDPIFDLAALESTYPDGTRSFFQATGMSYYTLVERYTYDDGHLNDIGSKIIAANLLLFLAQLADH